MLGHKRLYECDGDGYAPNRVEGQHKDGPPGPDSKAREIRRFEQAQILSEEIWIEQGLRKKRLFEASIGERKHEDAGPSATRLANPLGNQERAASVQRRQNHQHA